MFNVPLQVDASASTSCLSDPYPSKLANTNIDLLTKSQNILLDKNSRLNVCFKFNAGFHLCTLKCFSIMKC